MIDSGEAAIDDTFWERRLAGALAYRERVVEDSEACRLFSADADGIPGLVVDRYGDHLVVQSLVPGVERRLDRLADLLSGLARAESITARNDSAVRAREGLPREVRMLRGEAPGVVAVKEGGIVQLVDPAGGQKTGAFLDQRENRRAAARYARGRALDVFCYHGSFALQAAGRCESVTAVDSSAVSLARGRDTAERNGVETIEFVEANAFDFLRAMDRSGAKADTIFLDPPAFAKGRKDLPAARRAYKEINLRALKMLSPGGVLVTSSCSANLSEPEFEDLLRDAAADARRTVRVVERRGAARDHPARLGLPESRYLKCFILQV